MDYKINNFQYTISKLNPENQRTIQTEISSKWTAHFAAFPWIAPILSSLYDGDSYSLSRRDIFSTIEKRSRVVKILFWGYPEAFRDNSYLRSILVNIDRIIDGLPEYNTRLTKSQFKEVYDCLSSINGMKMSTISKIMCFWGVSVASSQALIVDQNVLESIHLFFELWGISLLPSSADDYLSAIKKINRLSRDMKVSPQQLELFLFNVGKIVKENRKSLFRQLLQFSSGVGIDEEMDD